MVEFEGNRNLRSNGDLLGKIQIDQYVNLLGKPSQRDALRTMKESQKSMTN